MNGWYNMINDLLYNSILGAVLGSIVGVVLSFIAKSVYDSRRDKKSLADLRSGIARAFWAEITALFALYEGLKLVPWDPPEKNIDYNMLNIQYDYLSIFNSNADKIGLFPHEDAVEFIKFYTFAKSYIDSLRELSRRYKNHMNRYEKLRMNPNDKIIISVFNESVEDLRQIYQYCYEQQNEFYRRRDVVKKTFEKYL